MFPLVSSSQFCSVLDLIVVVVDLFSLEPNIFVGVCVRVQGANHNTATIWFLEDNLTKTQKMAKKSNKLAK